MNESVGGALSLVALREFPLVQSGDDLAQIIKQSLGQNGVTLQDGDILVIAQKVISKAEGRQIALDAVQPRERARELARLTGKDPRLVELILQESSQVLRARQGLIVVEHRLGFICANAGIDRSNVSREEITGDESVLLLPENPDCSAGKIRSLLEEAFGVRLGVLVIDSHGRAWRNGTVGISIGLSGLPGVVDLRGEPDLFGYRLQTTETAAADELAAGASLLMGQADEGTPVIHVRGFPYALREASFAELPRDKEKDLFR
ncbi:MAG TPA: coenzyme F420-0:L-glutamate ligase [Chloroflexi bacterium]|nr:MAG: coenzyme F420-0:L-glutamate ligase [Chloroflexota bacterium]HDD55510.1 coenzyme F420-0:L-glutamate ligase [Chloroflexota bacterium]